MKVQLNSFFDNNHVFTPMQFGFRAGKSSVAAIELVVKNIYEAFEHKLFSSLIVTDLSKAFDCVSYDLLFMKLSHYGVRGNCLNIFSSYLTNRKQRVFLNESWSDLININCGVPQGSILGPFLFIIMINDIVKNVPAMPILYADDTSFLGNYSDLDNLKFNFELIMESAENWFSNNAFILNKQKTQHLIFSLRECDNEYSSVKLLGFHLDFKLNWNDHILQICKKLSRVIFVLRRLVQCVSISVLKNVYFALFHTHLLYGTHIWGHSSNSSKVFKLQKQALRIMSKKSYNFHCKPLFVYFEILTFPCVYIYSCLVYVKERLSEYSIRADIHSYNTRNQGCLHTKLIRTSKVINGWEANGVKFFNKLPPSAREVSMIQFKKTVFSFLKCNPFYSIDEFLKYDLCGLLF